MSEDSLMSPTAFERSEFLSGLQNSNIQKSEVVTLKGRTQELQMTESQQHNTSILRTEYDDISPNLINSMKNKINTQKYSDGIRHKKSRKNLSMTHHEAKRSRSPGQFSILKNYDFSPQARQNYNELSHIKDRIRENQANEAHNERLKFEKYQKSRRVFSPNQSVSTHRGELFDEI